MRRLRWDWEWVVGALPWGSAIRAEKEGGVERAFTMPDSSLTELAELQNLRKLSLHAFCMARWYSLRSS